MVSISQRGEMIYIVGTAEFTITRIWSILCKSMQWLPCIEAVLNILSIEGDGVVIEDTQMGGGILGRDVSF